MNSRMLMTLALGAAVLTALPSARTTVAPGAGIDARAAFERLKWLEGSWRSSSPGGRQAVTRFELTGNGTVLVEHYSNPAMAGGGRMMTAYHLDGPELVLTHYCIANNQPTLRADRYESATGELQFEFVRSSNLASPSAGHMRRAMYRITGRNQFTTEWEFFENGRKTMTETEVFERVQ